MVINYPSLLLLHVICVSIHLFVWVFLIITPENCTGMVTNKLNILN